MFRVARNCASSAATDANGIVYFGSTDKNLYAIGAHPVSPTTVPTTIFSLTNTLHRTTSPQEITSTRTRVPVNKQVISLQDADQIVGLPVLGIVFAGVLLPEGDGSIIDRRIMSDPGEMRYNRSMGFFFRVPFF